MPKRYNFLRKKPALAVLVCALFIFSSVILIKNVYAYSYGDVVIKRIILPKTIAPGTYFSAKLIILNKVDTPGNVELVAKMPAFYNYENVSLKGKDITIVSIVLKAPQKPTPCIFKIVDGDKTIAYSQVLINPENYFLTIHCPKIVQTGKYFVIDGYITEESSNDLNIYVDGKYYASVKTNPDGSFETEMVLKKPGERKITVSLNEFSTSCNVYAVSYEKKKENVKKPFVEMSISSRILPLEKCGSPAIEYVFVNAKNIDKKCRLKLNFEKNSNLFVSSPIEKYLSNGLYTFPIYISGNLNKSERILIYLDCGGEILANESFVVHPTNYCGSLPKIGEKRKEFYNYNLILISLGIFSLVILILIFSKNSWGKLNDSTRKAGNGNDYNGDLGSEDVIFASYDQVIE